MMDVMEKLKAHIEELYDDQVVRLWNEYVALDKRYDDEIFPMDDFDEIIGEIQPFDLARLICYGEFSPCHEYFWYNGYGNLESSDRPKESPFCMEDMIKYIVENDEDLDDEGIREILDDAENSDDDDDDDDDEEEEEEE